MKKYILLILLSIAINLKAFCSTWTISNSENSFTPSSITITVDDNVDFILNSLHNAREISQETWNLNGNTALSGGFETAFGGGLISSSQLGIGTHYFVCSIHASMGMKGIIIVQSEMGLIENKLRPNISIFPNPSKGTFNVNISGLHFKKKCNLEIYDLRGQKMLDEINLIQEIDHEIDLSHLGKGFYFLKFYDGIKSYNRKILIQ